MPYSRKKSIILLSLLELFERICYFGTSSTLLMYTFDQFDLSSEFSLKIYSGATIIAFILPLPIGILTDKFFNQKNGVLYGGIIALIGYLLLILNGLWAIGLGLILILIGTSSIRPNLTVLVGRLFDKTEKKRGFAFLVYHFFINLGAFISLFILGLVSEIFDTTLTSSSSVISWQNSSSSIVE